MMTRFTRFLLPVYCLVTVLEIAGELLPNKLLLYGCKPLIMLLLVVWLGQNRTHWRVIRPTRWLLVGMGFAGLGDVLLMIREVDLFGPGLASFLVMQVCYIGAFWQEIRVAKKRLSERRIALALLPFVAYAGGFLLYLDHPFHQTPGTDGLWIPVVVYVVCLSLMAVMAALRWGAVPPGSYERVLIGAVLFMLSDSAIAINKFTNPFAGASLVVMTTYAAAQYLIVTGYKRV
jgi:uncharacterized membrane protein YhhN